MNATTRAIDGRGRGGGDDAGTTTTRGDARGTRDGREGRETRDDDDAEAALGDGARDDERVVCARETAMGGMGASATTRKRDEADDGEGVWDDDDDDDDDANEEEDFVGACRVCLFDVTREDIRDARAIRLGCACVSAVVHVDAECLDAWVMRSPRKSNDNSCEICLERMTNVPTRAELRKERRSRREKHRARTASSSSSASARDDDARDDDARARDLEIGVERRFGDVSRRERCCLFACAPLACAYAVVHVFCAHRSCVFALILLAIGVSVLTRVSILL